MFVDVKERVALPDGLDRMPPGPELAAALAAVDLGALSGYDCIVALRAFRRMASHYTARTYTAMTAVCEALAHDDGSDEIHVYDAASAEVRAALTWTRRAADIALGMALDLRDRLPRVAAALFAGDIDEPRARAILDGVAHLDDEPARTVVGAIIADASGLTTGQLRARIRKLCIEADPEDARRRYGNRVAERRLVAEPTGDGTANLLGLDLPPHRAAEASKRINTLARSLRAAGETRTMDQLRADVFLDLLCGAWADTSAKRGAVEIRVDLATLAGLAARPGDLAGFGPVVADIARQVADEQARGEWRWVVSDPESGDVVSTGTTRRRPVAAQRRHVLSRYPTCVFPGCRMPAADCDLDHRTPWSHCRITRTAELAPLCRHDHRIRHQGWSYRRLPDGDHEWTSRLGHRYRTSGLPP